MLMNDCIRKIINGVNLEEIIQYVKNNLYEKINTRTKPFMKAKDLKNINENDICLKYVDNIPISF